MTTPDIWMLIFYLLLMVGVGVYFSRENTSASEMFAAGGRSPWWVAGLSGYMTFFSAGAFVVWGGLAYKYGMIAIAINVTHGIAALLAGYFIAGRWKRLGVSTPAEYVELRFGQRAVTFYIWTMLVIRIISSAVALYSLSVLVAALVPLPEGAPFRDQVSGNLSAMAAIVVFGVIVMAYTMIGGLWAVLMTDVLQFIIILITVLFTAILSLKMIGGVSVFAATAPTGFFNLTNEEFSLFFLAGWTALHFFQFGAEWAFAQRFLSVPKPRDARWAMYLFGVLYVVSPIIFFAPPMIYRVINPNANAEEAYILASALVLPTGMLGMVLAAMFSATASMISSQLNVFAGVLTSNVIVPRLSSKTSEAMTIRIGRICTIGIGTFVTVMALAIPYLGGAEALVFLMMSFIGPLFAPAVWGLLDRRIGARELAISIALSFALALLLRVGFSGMSLLASFEFLSPMVSWASNHPRSLDIYYAVLTPVISLSVLHFLLKRKDVIDQGAKRLLDHAEAPTPEVVSVSRLPARVVAVALFLAALSILSLVPLNADHVLALSFTAGVLFLSAALMATVGWLRAAPESALPLEAEVK